MSLQLDRNWTKSKHIFHFSKSTHADPQTIDILGPRGAKKHSPAVLIGQPGEPDAHGAGDKYIEMFSWKDEDSMKLAHESPDVMAVWEGIGSCCSSMDFPGYTVFA